MGHLLPRKIKKACKGATLVYNNECTLTGVMLRIKRDTKWKRKALAYIARQERIKHQIIEAESCKNVQDAIKRYLAN
jgi:hypothetical protein